MSTNDVPGAKPENADTLHGGCWAEHSDGSMMVVYAVEGGRVIFSIFNLAASPPLDYRTAMNEEAFKLQFSWRPSDKKSVKWTWHDKSPFPWSRVVQADMRPMPSTSDQVTAALSAVESLALVGITPEGKPIDPKALEHLRSVLSRPSAKAIADKIQAAIASCDAPESTKAALIDALSKPTPPKKGLWSRIRGK
jgi:hypothetical protein